MRPDDLIRAYPVLYHMTEDVNWPSIRRHGLLSTSGLVELFEIRGAQRKALIEERRPESVLISHPRVGQAVVRDNKPMSEAKLARALVGMTARAWYRLLNGMSFFWVREERVITLLSARGNRDRAHCVIVVNTARLLADHLPRVRLSPINSGNTAYLAARRGRSTFRPIGSYDYEQHRAARGRDAVVELTVIGGIRNVERYVDRVERWRENRRIAHVWP